MATSTNTELLALSGPRTPYPGKAGRRREEGVLADLLIFNGDPLQDINLIADPERNFMLVMKGSRSTGMSSRLACRPIAPGTLLNPIFPFQWCLLGDSIQTLPVAASIMLDARFSALAN